MRTELESRPDRPPVLRRAFAGLVLVAAAALAVVLLVHLITAVFWTIVTVAVVIAVLWAIKTIVW